jgi:hypothetical protein
MSLPPSASTIASEIARLRYLLTVIEEFGYLGTHNHAHLRAQIHVLEHRVTDMGQVNALFPPAGIAFTARETAHWLLGHEAFAAPSKDWIQLLDKEQTATLTATGRQAYQDAEARATAAHASLLAPFVALTTGHWPLATSTSDVLVISGLGAWYFAGLVACAVLLLIAVIIVVTWHLGYSRAIEDVEQRNTRSIHANLTRLRHP